jgi:hypothetical protein
VDCSFDGDTTTESNETITMGLTVQTRDVTLQGGGCTTTIINDD